MLRWIADVNSLNPQIWHIVGKDNVMADMLSRARFEDGFAKSEEQEVSEDYFAMEQVYKVCAVREFRKKEYEVETLWIGRMLQGGDRALSSGETFGTTGVVLYNTGYMHECRWEPQGLWTKRGRSQALHKRNFN